MIIRPLTDHKWRGYTLEEIQDERIVNDARIEIQKTIIEDDFKSLRNGGSLKESGRKLLSAFNYIDYITLGITIFRKLRPILAFFRRKKR